MILIDLNVLLDVLQKREPHYRTSAAVIERVIERRITATLPAHAVTTVYYIVERYQDTAAAEISAIHRYPCSLRKSICSTRTINPIDV